MTTFKIISKTKFNHEVGWQELYYRTNRWKMDLSLYKQDLRLLKLVVNHYFSKDFEKKNQNMKVVKNNYLLHLNTYCHTLTEEINNHLNWLSDLRENPFQDDYHKFKKQHKYLKADIANFVKLLHRKREELFEITEYVLQTKELETDFRITTPSTKT